MEVEATEKGFLGAYGRRPTKAERAALGIPKPPRKRASKRGMRGPHSADGVYFDLEGLCSFMRAVTPHPDVERVKARHEEKKVRADAKRFWFDWLKSQGVTPSTPKRIGRP